MYAHTPASISLLFLSLLPSTLSTAIPSPFSRVAANSLMERQDACPEYGCVRATFYYSGTDPNQITACGEQYDPNGYTAALPIGFPSPNNDPKYWCGRSIYVSAEDGSGSATLTVTDVDATGCLGPYHLDLTPAAFNQIGANYGGTDGAENGEIPV